MSDPVDIDAVISAHIESAVTRRYASLLAEIQQLRERVAVLEGEDCRQPLSLPNNG